MGSKLTILRTGQVRVRGHGDASGASCVFFRHSTSSRRGFKSYRSTREALLAWAAQDLAAKNRIGPPVIGTPSFGIGVFGAGYWTVVAGPHDGRDNRDLRERAAKLFDVREVYDVSYGHNVGVLRGEHVIIDFGHHLFSHGHEPGWYPPTVHEHLRAKLGIRLA
jgi:hypothetical protein